MPRPRKNHVRKKDVVLDGQSGLDTPVLEDTERRWGLQRLVAELNALRRGEKEYPKGLDPMQYEEEWKAVQAILLEFTPYACAGLREPYSPKPVHLMPSFELAIRIARGRFNSICRKILFRLLIASPGPGKDAGTLVVTAMPDRQELGGVGLFLLWDYYFRNRGWERVKLCKQCWQWFVDSTKNHKKELCSPSCRNRYWSRDRRREAGHGNGKVRHSKKSTAAQRRKAEKEG